MAIGLQPSFVATHINSAVPSLTLPPQVSTFPLTFARIPPASVAPHHFPMRPPPRAPPRGTFPRTDPLIAANSGGTRGSRGRRAASRGWRPGVGSSGVEGAGSATSISIAIRFSSLTSSHRLSPLPTHLHPLSQTSAELLALRPTVVRGNASEVLALAGAVSANTRGVDSTVASTAAVAAAQQLASERLTVVAVSGATDFMSGLSFLPHTPHQGVDSTCREQQNSSPASPSSPHPPTHPPHQGVDSTVASTAAVAAAQQLASQGGTVVAVSGATDFTTDGHTMLACGNGVPLLQAITATGCSVTALITAFVAAADGHGPASDADLSPPLLATACALAVYG
ncbi:unnamed protein product [Closterium sp. NIES-65]|nr:unnamed protein product [Closterium sp. NIES-65]